jgi:hypothetical protein
MEYSIDGMTYISVFNDKPTEKIKSLLGFNSNMIRSNVLDINYIVSFIEIVNNVPGSVSAPFIFKYF